MDPAVASIVVAAITTSGLFGVALVNILHDKDKAVDKAVAPLKDLIARLRELVITLGGDPDDA